MQRLNGLNEWLWMEPRDKVHKCYSFVCVIHTGSDIITLSDWFC